MRTMVASPCYWQAHDERFGTPESKSAEKLVREGFQPPLANTVAMEFFSPILMRRSAFAGIGSAQSRPSETS